MKRSANTIFRWISFFFLLTAKPAFSAADAVGTIISTRGETTLVRADDSERQGEVGQEIFGGDRLRTCPDGRIACRLSDGGTLRLGPDSELVAEDDRFPAFEDEPSIFRLTIGFLRAIFPKSDSAPQIHTPTAVIGVRGTAYDAAFSLDTETAVAVDEGRVFLELWERTAELDAGQMGEFSAEPAPIRVQPAAAPERRDWPRWRERREGQIAKHLVRFQPVFKQKSETAERRILLQADELETACREILEFRQEMGDARKREDREAFRYARRNFRKALPPFRQRVRRLRRQYNRLKSISDHCRHILAFVENHPDRFAAKEAGAIQSGSERILALDIRMETRLGTLRTLIRETMQTAERPDDPSAEPPDASEEQKNLDRAPSTELPDFKDLLPASPIFHRVPDVPTTADSSPIPKNI